MSGGTSHPLQAQVETPLWEWEAPATELTDVPPGIGLHLLALQGRWQEVASSCSNKQQHASSNLLAVKTFHIMALMKLKVYQEAALQFEAIGDDISQWPFALRWLHADLPAAMGRPLESHTLFHSLISWCAAQEADARNIHDLEQAALYARRCRSCTLALVARYTAAHHYKAALALLRNLLEMDPHDAQVWSQVARVQILLGDLASAEQSVATGKKAAKIQNTRLTDAAAGKQAHVELAKDAAFLALVGGRVGEAAQGYRQCLKSEVEDGSLVSNAAVCLTQEGKLGEAKKELERAFMERPMGMLSEPFVSNMAALYETAAATAVSGDAVQAKRRMGVWAAAVAPDDFDLTCCKVGPVRGGS